MNKKDISDIAKRITKDVVIFDIETDSPEPQSAYVISFSGLRINKDGTSTSLQFLTKPPVPIPAEASAVNGITDDMVADKPPFSHFAAEVAAFIRHADIIGYNNRRFDVPIMDRELSQCGFCGTMDDALILDTFVKYRKHQSQTLTDAYKYYTNDILKDAHNAEVDTMATGKIFLAQLKMDNDTPANVFCQDESPPGKRIGFSKHIIWKDGKYVMNFSKNYKGMEVKDVEVGFLRWVLKQDFPYQVKDFVKQEIQNIQNHSAY